MVLLISVDIYYASDSYIEEEGRPQSQITASLYGEVPYGMMGQQGNQWVNKSAHGHLPPVSFLPIEI